MKFPVILFVIFFFAVSAFAGVSVSSPSNGATVGSPVNFAAKGSTGCSKGVASMGIYTAPYKLAYVVSGSSLNTDLKLDTGTYHTVVEEWDNCGGATTTPITITVSDKAGVFVSSPANNSTVGSPVEFAASASTGCAQGVAAMGIYTAPYKKAYVSSGATLKTSLALSPGTYNAVVEEWDKCGGASVTPVKFTVKGDTFFNVQAGGGWSGFGELAPRYDICTDCTSSVAWSLKQGISSPSLSGKAAKFYLGGSTVYSDALWNNHLIGDLSSQGLPDTKHTLVASLHNFSYDVYFYGDHLEDSQALEFDIGQFTGDKGYMFGTECNIVNGKQWEVWDNVNAKWVATGKPCDPPSGKWNHLILKVQRTSDNKLLYKTITLNGTTYTLNWYLNPYSTPAWNGVVINFQMDGNHAQTPYTVYLDKLNFSYY